MDGTHPCSISGCTYGDITSADGIFDICSVCGNYSMVVYDGEFDDEYFEPDYAEIGSLSAASPGYPATETEDSP